MQKLKTESFLEIENGWDNTKRAKTPYFHSDPSIKN